MTRCAGDAGRVAERVIDSVGTLWNFLIATLVYDCKYMYTNKLSEMNSKTHIVKR
jgi:hypothetical protein